MAVLILAAVSTVVAQVPQLLNYQGRVKVSGADFTGTGQFKFAMVSSTGATTFWSNDGTSTSGSQPAAAVSLPVQGGLYQLLLGDATLPNMTALPTAVFSNQGVNLRVWFSDGANGWQQLTPDQRVAAVGYAMMADNIKDGAVSSNKLADNAVTASKLAPGAVTSTALAPTAVADSLAASGQGTVPSGASLISPVQNAPSLLAAGYVNSGTINAGDTWSAIAGATARDDAASVWTGTEFLVWGDGPSGWRYNPATNIWTPMTTTNQPAARTDPTAVWTGTEMIVWGGFNGTDHLSTGGKYNPDTNTWIPMSNAAAPAGRVWHTAVWSGTEMIVFGGANAAVLGNGGRYNPTIGTGGTWTALEPVGAPSIRYYHSAVWTGSEMIIFAGRNGVQALNSGARFNPAGTGSWTALPVGPSARYYHTAVWAVDGMIIWGGSDSGATTPLNTGSIYRRSNNTWAPLPTAGVPDARLQHSVVWTGSDMIVWGGTTSSSAFVYTNTGGRYSPVNNTWTQTGTTGAPASRVNPLAAWTGTEMIIWGGSNGAPLDGGGRYRSGQTLYLYQRP